MTLPSRQTPQADPASEAGDLIARVGIFVLAVAVPIAGVFSRRVIFSLPPIGVVLILIGALLRQRRADIREAFAPILSLSGLSLLFIIVWSGASLLWTPMLSSGSSRFFRMAITLGLIVFAGGLSPRRTRTSNLYLAPMGVAIASVALLVEAFWPRTQLAAQSMSLDDSTLARASVGVLILLWPAMTALAVRERWRTAVALAILAALSIVAVGSPFAIAAAVGGFIVFGLARLNPQRTAVVCAYATAAAIVTAPFVLLALGGLAQKLFAHSNSFAAIESISDFILKQGVHVVTGHGLDALADAASVDAPELARRSSVFEVWYELGALGALAQAALAVGAFLWSARTPQPMAAYAIAALAVGVLLSVAVLPTSQLWWLTLCALAALSFVFAKRGRYRTRRPLAPQVSAGESQQTLGV